MTATWATPVLDIAVAAPGSPATGDRYLVAHSGTSGSFVGHEDQVAEWTGSVWDFSGAPLPGQSIIVRIDFILRRFNGTTWTPLHGSAAAAGSVANIVTMDTACAAMKVSWHLDYSFTLTGNTTYAARIMGLGGIISRGSYTLTGEFWAPPNVAMFDRAGTGLVTISGPSRVAYAKWWDPAGDNSTDDTVPLQGFITTVCGQSMQGYFNGIRAKITAALAIPNGAAYYGLHGQGAWIIQATNNTPILNPVLTVANTQSNAWEIDGFNFDWTNTQSSSNTRAIGICFSASADGPGWFDFAIRDIRMPNHGYMAIGRDPASTHINIQWQCEIHDIFVGNGVTGGVIDFLTGYSGAGSPVIHIGRIYQFALNATKPSIQLYSYHTVRIEDVERNSYSGAGLMLMDLQTCSNVFINNSKVEGEVYTADTVLISIANTHNAEVDGFEVVSPTLSAGKLLIVAKNAGTNIGLEQSQLTVRNTVVLDNLTGLHGYLCACSSDKNPIIVGRNVLPYIAPPGSLPMLRFERETWAQQIVSNVQTIGAYGQICNVTVPRDCALVKATIRLVGVTGGSAAVDVRHNGLSISGGGVSATLNADGVTPFNIPSLNGPTGASNVLAAGDSAEFFIGEANSLTGSVTACCSFVFAPLY